MYKLSPGRAIRIGRCRELKDFLAASSSRVYVGRPPQQPHDSVPRARPARWGRSRSKNSPSIWPTIAAIAFIGNRVGPGDVPARARQRVRPLPHASRPSADPSGLCTRRRRDAAPGEEPEAMEGAEDAEAMPAMKGEPPDGEMPAEDADKPDAEKSDGEDAEMKEIRRRRERKTRVGTRVGRWRQAGRRPHLQMRTPEEKRRRPEKEQDE